MIENTSRPIESPDLIEPMTQLLKDPRSDRVAIDQQLPVTGDTPWIESLPNGSAEQDSDDRVIRSLARALEAAEQGRDRNCAEALRLAIAIRFAGLRLEAQGAPRLGQAEPKGRQVCALQKWRLKRVVEYVDNHLGAKISLMDLAAVAGLSRMHFASQFRAATGLRPHEYLLRRRIRRAEELLRNSTMAIVEIALTVGFQTQAHFTTVFKRFVGCTPRQWRNVNQMPAVPRIGNSTPTDVTAAA
jgi:AraC family transcriptional regulator